MELTVIHGGLSKESGNFARPEDEFKFTGLNSLEEHSEKIRRGKIKDEYDEARRYFGKPVSCNRERLMLSVLDTMEKFINGSLIDENKEVVPDEQLERKAEERYQRNLKEARETYGPMILENFIPKVSEVRVRRLPNNQEQQERTMNIALYYMERSIPSIQFEIDEVGKIIIQYTGNSLSMPCVNFVKYLVEIWMKEISVMQSPNCIFDAITSES
jgi:hypothetical protein